MSDEPKLTAVPKVSVLPVITSLDVPTERILQAALEEEDALQSVVVLGWKASGEMYFASSFAGGPEVLWLIEMAKMNLLEMRRGEE